MYEKKDARKSSKTAFLVVILANYIHSNAII